MCRLSFNELNAKEQAETSNFANVRMSFTERPGAIAIPVPRV